MCPELRQARLCCKVWDLGCYIAGDEEFKERMEYLVEELHKVQDALGAGYLSAFPKEHFIRLQSLQAVWAPFYVGCSSPISITVICVYVLSWHISALRYLNTSTSPVLCALPVLTPVQSLGHPMCAVQIHKLLAGLFDTHTFLGNELALDMVWKEVDYFLAYHDHVVAINGTLHWVKMLDNEFGGMAESLFKLYDITQNPDHLRWGMSWSQCLTDVPHKDPCRTPSRECCAMTASFVQSAGLGKHSSSRHSISPLSRMRTPLVACMPTHTLLRWVPCLACPQQPAGTSGWLQCPKHHVQMPMPKAHADMPC